MAEAREGDRRVSVIDEFRSLAADWDLGEPVTEATPLVASGSLDSLALFKLAMWAEERTGKELDPATFDPSTEWATVGDFLAFVGGSRRESATPPAAGVDTVVTLGGREYRIETYDPGKKAAVARFLRGIWTRDEAINTRYIQWKFESNPCAAGSTLYLAYFGSELVGARGFHGSMWEAGLPPRRFPVLLADDLLIAPEHRNVGLFNHLMRYALDDLARRGHDCVLSVSANEINVLGSLATGWQGATPWRMMHRRKLTRRVASRLTRAAARVPVLARWLHARRVSAPPDALLFGRPGEDPRPVPVAGGRRVEVLREAPIEEMVRFIGERPYDGRIRLVRDSDYLRWRFENPFSEYRFLVVRGRAGELEAYATLMRFREALMPAIVISDLEARDAEAAAAIVSHLTQHACAGELLAAGASLSAEHEALFRRHGFDDQPVREGQAAAPRVLVKLAGADAAATWNGRRLLDESAWDLRLLYSMRG